MPGTIGILSVGAGDIRLTFDPANQAEMIRAARIVKDMLQRGYALLIQIDDGQGGKTYARATGFDEKTNEYIIADLDPVQAEADADLKGGEETPAEEAPARPEKRPRGGRRVAATTTSGVAVARTAGG